MKVLLVSLYHPELVRGGAQQIAYELFEGLKAGPGIEPTLLASVDHTRRLCSKPARASPDSMAGRASFFPQPGLRLYLGENLQRPAGGIFRGILAADPAGRGAFSPFLVLWHRFADADAPDAAGGENRVYGA